MPLKDDTKEYFEANRRLWNARTPIHAASEFYSLDKFRKGQNPLNDTELTELGDVKGKSLLHLQCHFGMDTLGWARLGAKCTGVDISDKSIDLAKELSREQKEDVEFICCNVYDTARYVTQQFDIVYTSYGTIGWLPNLDQWAAVVAGRLKPGGTFYMVDFHPVVWMFDNDFTKVAYTYHKSEVIREEEQGTYADKTSAIQHESYGWNHGLGEIINALIGSGLEIMRLNEFPYSNYNCFNNTVKGEDGKYRIKGMEGLIPMMYSIKALKPVE